MGWSRCIPHEGKRCSAGDGLKVYNGFDFEGIYSGEIIDSLLVYNWRICISAVFQLTISSTSY